MKRLVLCVTAAMLVAWVGFQLSADEPPAADSPANVAAVAEPVSKSEAAPPSKGRDRSKRSEEKARPYPVFSIEEVINHLTRSGARLHRERKTKTDVELRKHLNRKTCELTLPAPSDTIVNDRELYQRACESIFLVCSLYRDEAAGDWQTSLATAFAVTEDGVLSTSCHVFDNEDHADAVIVMDVHKNVYPVTELLAANRRSDTCLFRIDARNLKPLPLGDDAVPGTPVRIVAHPGDSFYYFSSGHLANYERDDERTVWMNVTADFGQGSSGGPVFNEHGHVIGLVSRTFTLYAGNAETRGRPRRTAGETKLAEKTATDAKTAAEEFLDPQMVFKSCVPVRSLRDLVKIKEPPAGE